MFEGTIVQGGVEHSKEHEEEQAVWRPWPSLAWSPARVCTLRSF